VNRWLPFYDPVSKWTVTWIWHFAFTSPWLASFCASVRRLLPGLTEKDMNCRDWHQCYWSAPDDTFQTFLFVPGTSLRIRYEPTRLWGR
jgi:hypothetical protein